MLLDLALGMLAIGLAADLAIRISERRSSTRDKEIIKAYWKKYGPPHLTVDQDHET